MINHDHLDAAHTSNAVDVINIEQYRFFMNKCSKLPIGAFDDEIEDSLDVKVGAGSGSGCLKKRGVEWGFELLGRD